MHLRPLLIDTLDWGRAVGLIALGVVMVVVFVAGIAKVTVASFVLARTGFLGQEQETAMAITEFLRGFEFFFLAPLGLLTFRALGKYVRAQLNDPRQHSTALTHAKEAAEHEVNQLKILIGSLIAAFLLTDLVSKVIIGSGRPELWSLSGELSVLAGAILYVWSLSRSH
jgi:hypothetical protein